MKNLLLKLNRNQKINSQTNKEQVFRVKVKKPNRCLLQSQLKRKEQNHLYNNYLKSNRQLMMTSQMTRNPKNLQNSTSFKKVFNRISKKNQKINLLLIIMMKMNILVFMKKQWLPKIQKMIQEFMALQIKNKLSLQLLEQQCLTGNNGLNKNVF